MKRIVANISSQAITKNDRKSAQTFVVTSCSYDLASKDPRFSRFLKLQINYWLLMHLTNMRNV